MNKITGCIPQLVSCMKPIAQTTGPMVVFAANSGGGKSTFALGNANKRYYVDFESGLTHTVFTNSFDSDYIKRAARIIANGFNGRRGVAVLPGEVGYNPEQTEKVLRIRIRGFDCWQYISINSMTLRIGNMMFPIYDGASTYSISKLVNEEFKKQDINRLMSYNRLREEIEEFYEDYWEEFGEPINAG